jgi:HlyD family secretion protein
MVDKPRPSQARKKRIKRILYSTLTVGLVAAATFGVYQLEPAAPRVEAATLYPGEVRRGEMVREVRGIGRLVPEEIRWITTKTSGAVEQILVEPGVQVTPGTVLVELSSPQLERDTRDAELDLAAADAEHANLLRRLEADLRTQEDAIRSAELDLELAETDYNNEVTLQSEGLAPDSTVNTKRVALERARQRVEAAERALETARLSNEGQIEASEARLDQQRGALELKQDELDALRVRAGVSGVLQQLEVEVGQNVGTGANVARVADPTRLKAELDINESQVGDVRTGQLVLIDLRPTVLEGTVTRIDPAVSGGIVKVDARFDDPLPANSRPDQSVDGLIEIERLEDVLYLSPRPSIGQANSTVGLFVINDDGEAVRRTIRLGRTSANSVEVLEGLEEGDRVVLSDMSQWDDFDRVRLD